MIHTTIYEAPDMDLPRPHGVQYAERKRREHVDPTLAEARALWINWRDGDVWRTARLHSAPDHVLASEAQRWKLMAERFPDAPPAYGYRRYYRACEIVLASREGA